MAHWKAKPSPASAMFSSPTWVWGMILVVVLFSGCQSSRVRWNLFNWQNLDRVPPPATGTLSIPGVSNSGYPTSALPPPPTTLPSATGLPTVNPQGYNGNAQPGVYFNQPTTNSWQNTGGAAGQPLSAIPGRDASTGWTGLPNSPNGMPGNAGSGLANNPVASVPPMLSGDSFDPFSTDRIPAWTPEFANPGPNPLTIRSPASTVGVGQTGWWPEQGNYANAPQTSNLGDGRVLRNMQQSVTQFFNQQPANVGGFQTTTPIENPMILATGYQQGIPNQAAPVNPTPIDPQQAAQQWAQIQQQQLDNLRAQQMQQFQAAAANQPGLVSGSSSLQVLAESTTSHVAENQARLGLRTAPGISVDPRYAGRVPQGSAFVNPTQLR